MIQRYPEAQVMTAYLGFDATKISDAINKASDIRSECYTKETADAFNEKLEAAKKAASTAGAKQADVDAAADALTDAQAKLVRKSENLTSDVLVNTDFTDKTSTVDKSAKTVTNDGYTLRLLVILIFRMVISTEQMMYIHTMEKMV